MSGFGFEVRSPEEAIEGIKHTVLVMSGKGGVGKTFITVNLASVLALKGYSVGIMDADIHGPSIPKMLGISGSRMYQGEIGITPVVGPLGMRVVSIDFLLPTSDTPVIWRGPLKSRMIKEFINNIEWGELDFLFVDLPPGTGDEPLSVVQELRKPSGAVIVTIPTEVSQIVVRKAVVFARQVKVPILGIVENMSGFTCPDTGKTYMIFGAGGGEAIAKAMNVPFLGSIPLDPRIAEASDKGVPFVVMWPDTPATKAITNIALKIAKKLGENAD